VPNLTETFDQVKRSTEIRSSECFPKRSPHQKCHQKPLHQNK